MEEKQPSWQRYLLFHFLKCLRVLESVSKQLRDCNIKRILEIEKFNENGLERAVRAERK